MPSNGRLFVVSAPSGAGKTSLLQAIVEGDSCPRIEISVSHTTRPQRPTETDGVHYHFTAREAFQRLLDAGGFLEWAEVFGHLYGTSRHNVEQRLANGIDVLLEIDCQGAIQVINALNPISIFILPPSLDSLRERLQQRGHDSPQEVDRRLAQAIEEIRHAPQYDYCIVNDHFHSARARLEMLLGDTPLPSCAIPKQTELIAHLCQQHASLS